MTTKARSKATFKNGTVVEVMVVEATERLGAKMRRVLGLEVNGLRLATRRPRTHYNGKPLTRRAGVEMVVSELLMTRDTEVESLYEARCKEKHEELLERVREASEELDAANKALHAFTATREGRVAAAVTT